MSHGHPISLQKGWVAPYRQLMAEWEKRREMAEQHLNKTVPFCMEKSWELFTCPFPLKFTRTGQGPLLIAIIWPLQKKNLQDEWVQVKNNDTKWYCFCSSTNFCSTWHVVGRYISPRFLISLLFRIWAFPACSDPVAQKRHHVVGLPAVSSFSPRLSVFKEQPILFVRKWAHYGSLILAAFFYNVDKEWSAHTHPFCPRAVSES